MIFHMKTTLIIDDLLMSQIKSFAAQQGRTLSNTVEALLRKGLRKERKGSSVLKALPVFDMGKCKVNIADRDALFRAMEK